MKTKNEKLNCDYRCENPAVEKVLRALAAEFEGIRDWFSVRLDDGGFVTRVALVRFNEGTKEVEILPTLNEMSGNTLMRLFTCLKDCDGWRLVDGPAFFWFTDGGEELNVSLEDAAVLWCADYLMRLQRKMTNSWIAGAQGKQTIN